MTARRHHRARGATASGTASCPGIPPAGAPSGRCPGGRQLPQRHGRVASLLRWRAFASACRTQARFPASPLPRFPASPLPREPGTGHRAPGTGHRVDDPGIGGNPQHVRCAGLQLTGAAPAAGSHPSGFQPGTRPPPATTTPARCPGAMGLSLSACDKRLTGSIRSGHWAKHPAAGGSRCLAGRRAQRHACRDRQRGRRSAAVRWPLHLVDRAG